MHITKLELKNYKCFDRIQLTELGSRVVLVGPNGCGKSAILEAIAVLKEYIATYDPNQNVYQAHLPLLNKHAIAWRDSLPLPIRADQPYAEVSAEFGLNDAESEKTGGEKVVTATIRIERTREITRETSHPGVQELFRSHDEDSGIGIIDYIGPDRRYSMQRLTGFDLSTLSVDHQRRERIEILPPNSMPQKFARVKQFIVAQQMNDLSFLNESGQYADSLSLLKELFTFFFGPKVLIGAVTNNDELKVIVDTAYGKHDIDELSSGEKELLTVFTSLFRIRSFEGVILYDEPERHLNPGLEAKIVPALDQLHSRNQLWISSHSAELIGSVPMREIIALPRLGSASAPTRFLEESKTQRYSLFESVGARIGVQLSSNRVVFLEGKNANSDKRLLDRLAGPRLPGVLFVASGGSEQVTGAATRASLLLEEASKDTAFLMVLDRDYRDDDSVRVLQEKLNNRVLVLACHEVENILLDPRAIRQVLVQNDSAGEFPTEASILDALRACAEALAEKIVYEAATYRLHNGFNAPSSGSPPDESSYLAMARSRRENLVVAYDEERAREILTMVRGEIDACLSDGTWTTKLPGKEILRRFRNTHIAKLNDDLFRSQITSAMIDLKIEPDEIRRLIEFVKAH